jgi:cytochrome P450
MVLVPARRAPPGPAGYPLIGVFPMARRDPLGFFLDCARRYGDLVSMRLGVHHVYLVSHPEHVKRVLQENPRAYSKGPPAARVAALFGDSLTLVDDERWRQRRRQVQPAFLPSQHAHFIAVTTRATTEMLDRWRLLAERGEPVELMSEMRRLTQTITIRALFGEVAEAEISGLGRAFDLAVAHVDRRLWSPLGWLAVPTPASARYRRALGTLSAFVSRQVEDARCAGPAPNTLLAALLSAPRAEGVEPLSDAELHDELKAFLVAGHTTTASALGWLWYVLWEHPEARDGLEQECRAVLAGGVPGADDLPRLGYSRRVIDEVLRLYPPTWLTARTASDNDELGGYKIPAGALILLSPYVTHRHPACWEEPERFDPDRFMPGRAAARPAFAYFPFGGGPRRCIGSAFATIEIQLILVQVAQRYRLGLLPGAHVIPAGGLTLRPHAGLPMLLSPVPAS